MEERRGKDDIKPIGAIDFGIVRARGKDTIDFGIGVVRRGKGDTKPNGASNFKIRGMKG